MRSGYSMQSRLLLLTRLVLVMLLGVPFPGYAMTVALQWDANVEDDLAGYKIYYKTGLSTATFDGTGAVEGDSPFDVLNQTTATISGLDPNHSYIFAVTAYNASGVESGYSNTVMIPELIAPTVYLSSPLDKSLVSETTTITANATDNEGIRAVEFYENGVLRAVVNTVPYSYMWDTTTKANGTYILFARALDLSGNVTQSANVSVTVNNSEAMASTTTSSLTISDALLALQIAVGKVSATTELQSRLDVAPVINGMSVPNGKIDTGDAIVILSNVVGKIAL